MNSFEFLTTSIEGVLEVQPFYVQDSRGRFLKDYSRDIFLQNGINYILEEVFYTNSYRGVIRGLHFQNTKPQPKLVRCLAGKIFDVVVDLRRGSPTYLKWLGFELSGDNNRQILVPAGCAHGYLVLEESIVSYKCAEKYYGEYDDGIIWNDESIGIMWPIEQIGGISNLILTEKDQKLQTLSEFRLNQDTSD